MNLDQYLPVILFILVGAVVGIAPQLLGALLGPNRPDAAKNSPYECGFEAFEDARMKFDVRYYLVAILFILFDLEIAFLFPWAVALKEIGATSGFWAMMIFLGHSGRRLCLRVEKRRPGLGMNAKPTHAGNSIWVIEGVLKRRLCHHLGSTSSSTGPRPVRSGP